jgi:hypothetical protein
MSAASQATLKHSAMSSHMVLQMMYLRFFPYLKTLCLIHKVGVAASCRAAW